jgi:predicted hydrocarbon binding protein
MLSPFKVIANELFKRQVEFTKYRYFLNLPLMKSERLNWIGSKHWALLQNTLVKRIGDDYYVDDYHAGKMWGYMFADRVASLVKTKRIMAEMMGLISEHLGFGKIEVEKLSYDKDWLTFHFKDSPISRESIKLYGYFEEPIDYSISGLIAGSAENVIGRRFVTIETECIAKNDSVCTFHTIGLNKVDKFIKEKIVNNKQKKVLEKIIALENEIDIGKKADELIKNQNKKATQEEKNYLENIK